MASPTSDQVVWAKAGAIFLLALSSFFIGILPVKIMAWKHTGQPFMVSILLGFGGGVLLFTTFMHLQPELHEVYEGLLGEHVIPEGMVAMDVDLPQLIFCIGFFFVYLVEEVVHLCLDRSHKEDEEEIALHRTLSMRKCVKEGGGPGYIPRVNPHRHGGGTPTASTQVLLKDPPVPTVSYRTDKNDSRSKTTEETGSGSSVRGVASTSTRAEVAKSFRGLLAVVALSFHAVFEGLAVGLERSPTAVWTLTAALATHKLVIVFCIGVELVGSGTGSCLVILYIAAFSAVTPLGIGIGIAVSSAPSPSLALASLVLQGMAAGTLLYVVFFEVLQREKHNHGGIFHLIAILVGFFVMFALQLTLGHRHGEGGHKSHHHLQESPWNETIFR